MDFSRLSYEQVLSLADQLNSSSQNMEVLLNEIKTLFNRIGTEEVWSGTAAAQTRELFDELSAKFPEFNQSVSDCYKYLLQVVENYKSVDASVMSQQ